MEVEEINEIGMQIRGNYLQVPIKVQNQYYSSQSLGRPRRLSRVARLPCSVTVNAPAVTSFARGVDMGGK